MASPCNGAARQIPFLATQFHLTLGDGHLKAILSGCGHEINATVGLMVVWKQFWAERIPEAGVANCSWESNISFTDDVGVDAVSDRDAGNGRSGLQVFLNDLGLERFWIETYRLTEILATKVIEPSEKLGRHQRPRGWNSEVKLAGRPLGAKRAKE